jgi:glyoxylase-like metal-dependent hydrolase (beta-lactamase superfamily II)
MTWTRILPNIAVFEDSCKVYAVIGPDGALIVNAGTGAWLDHLAELPARPVALACTHFFRDHSAGARRAAADGIAVYVPEGERELFADPTQHFRQRDTYIIYDNYWDLFAPIEAIPVAGVLRDHEAVRLAGLELDVIPLPGVTLGQIGLGLRTGDGPIVFCAEAIHSPGRVARVAPFQYNYNDLGGAVNAFFSARDLRRLRPRALLPSLGTPMLAGCDDALAQLQASLTALCAGRPLEAGQIAQADKPQLAQVTPHVWRTTQTSSINWFVISDSGQAMAIDFGYHEARGVLSAAYSKPYRRRALLHSLEELKERTDVDRIDVALISHFHDDHVCGVPLLQRLFGTQCWATEAFGHLLAEPDAHCFPCDWPQPIEVHRTFRHDEVANWEEYAFRFAPMNGHTRFSSLIGFEADGLRFAHTGDQYFFQQGDGEWATGELTRWDDKRVFQNHVYRNGALLDGYALSGDWLLRWRPHVVLSGHQPPMHTDEAFFRLVDDWSRDYAALHRRVMALGDSEAHFNLDSWGGWIWPYRTHITAPRPITVTVTVRNPLPRPATLDVRLVGPTGWSGTAAALQAGTRGEVSCELSITPSGPCRRQPFAVELAAGGRPFGQVAEALVTVGGAAF